ncbi:unnamed protein product, partial [Didymodactylos carnosus]
HLPSSTTTSTADKQLLATTAADTAIKDTDQDERKHDDFIRTNFTKFSGAVEEDPEAWLTEVLQVFESCEILESKWLSYVPSLLTSKARIWYGKYKATILDFNDFIHKLTTEFGSKATVTAFSTLPRNTSSIKTWQQFVKQIKDEFGSKFKQIDAFERLKNYKQSVNQSVIEFYNGILDISREIDPSPTDHNILQHLISNIKPSLKLKILEKQSTSISGFLSCGNTFEQLADLMKNDSLATAIMHEVIPRYVAPQRRYELQQPQHPYLNEEFQGNDYGRFSMDLNPSIQEQSQNRQTASASNSAQQPPMESKYNSKGKRYYNRGSQRLQNYTGCHICKAHNEIYNPSLIFVTLTVNNQMMRVMIDPGATNTIITEAALRKTKHQKCITRGNKHDLALADGSSYLNVIGTVELQIKVDKMITTIEVVVVKSLITDCIIGGDYIKKYALQIDAGKESVTIKKGNQLVTMPMEKQIDSLKVPIRLTKSVRIPPREEMNVHVCACLSAANVVFKPSYNFKEQIPVFMPNSLLEMKQHHAVLSVHNPTNYPCTLNKWTILGVSTLAVQQSSEITPSTKKLSVHEHIEAMLKKTENPQTLSDVDGIHYRDRFRKILLEFQHLFDNSQMTIAKTEVSHVINTSSHSPPCSKCYPMSKPKEEALYNILKELMKAGLMSKAKSPYAAPALLTL